MTRAADASHLIIRGDGEDLTRLDPDVRRFLKPIPTGARVACGVVVAIVLLAACVPYVVWVVTNLIASEEGRSRVPELMTGLSIPLAIPLVGLAIVAWVDVLIAVVGRAGRVAMRDAYLALVAADIRPRLATVRRCDYSSGETSSAFAVEVAVELESGRLLRAAERLPVPVRGAGGASYGYTAHQVPQYGDTVTVFTAPGASGLTIVQANHSWSRMRESAA